MGRLINMRKKYAMPAYRNEDMWAGKKLFILCVMLM